MSRKEIFRQQLTDRAISIENSIDEFQELLNTESMEVSVEADYCDSLDATLDDLRDTFNKLKNRI